MQDLYEQLESPRKTLKLIRLQIEKLEEEAQYVVEQINEMKRNDYLDSQFAKLIDL